MKKKKPKLILISCLALMITTGAKFGVDVPRINQLASQINYRQGSWIAMKADLHISFELSNQEKAECKGSIIYHRLDEKIIIDCFNQQKERLFILKTDDRYFELYLAPQKTIYSGNIFDLQESEEVESLLRPLSFYRSLKTHRFPQSRTEVETWNDDSAYLKINTWRNGSEFTSRRIEVTSAGDVTKEIYYNESETPLLTIERKDFEAFPGHFNQLFYFSKSIQLTDQNPIDPNKQSVTNLTFSNIEFVSHLKANVWKLDTPRNTKKINIRGKFLPVFANA